MTRHEYAHLDVFTDRAFGGNQLAVFHDGWGVSDAEMQAIAKELNLPETVFVAKPQKGGDHRLRIFTPARELPFAGHPTVGAAFFLSEGKDADLRLEEGVGTLTVTVRDGFTEMEQPLPAFKVSRPNLPEIARMLSLDVTDIHPTLNIQIGSSGNDFRFVPVRGLDAVRRAAPRELDVATFIFTTETLAAGATAHGRMYAPWQGVAEDPATGSACGPLAVYLVEHGISDGTRIVIEQGYEMGRPSTIYARVGRSGERITSVHVGGHCVRTGGGWVDL